IPRLGARRDRPPDGGGRDAESALFGSSGYNIGRRSPGPPLPRIRRERGRPVRNGPGSNPGAGRRESTPGRPVGRARRSERGEDRMTVGSRGRAQRILLFAWIVALFLPAPSHAQYFGQNKVQYKSFHWSLLKTEHFDVHYYE